MVKQIKENMNIIVIDSVTHSVLLRWPMIKHNTIHYQRLSHYNLAGGIPIPLKDMKVNWDDEIPS